MIDFYLYYSKGILESYVEQLILNINFQNYKNAR